MAGVEYYHEYLRRVHGMRDLEIEELSKQWDKNNKSDLDSVTDDLTELTLTDLTDSTTESTESSDSDLYIEDILPLSHYKYIVFDLDSTLVCTERIKHSNDAIPITITNAHDEDIEFWVHVRPGAREIIEYCFEHAEVGVWSMGTPDYVKDIVKILFPSHLKPTFVYNRTHSTKIFGRSYKNLGALQKLFGTSGVLPKILMIDDNLDVLITGENIHVHNIKAWEAWMHDDEELHALRDYNESTTLFGCHYDEQGTKDLSHELDISSDSSDVY
jgi:hypothetical protein